MKKTLLLIFAMFFVIVTASQSLAVSSLNEVIANKQQITKYNSSNELNNLLKSDVISYYKLNSVYDTELKKKNFFKTDEYKEKLAELTKLRTIALNKQYYVRFEGNDKYGNQNVIYNYSIKIQGILLKLHTALSVLYTANLLDGVLFKFLPTVVTHRTDYSGEAFIDEFLFVPMNEDRGALIENNKSLIDVIVTFSSKVSSDSFYAEADCPANLYLANRDTGEIYFETTYQCVKPSKKKETKKTKKK